MGVSCKVRENHHNEDLKCVFSLKKIRLLNVINAGSVFVGFVLLLLSSGVFFPYLSSTSDYGNGVTVETIPQVNNVSLSAIEENDTWTQEEYKGAIDDIFNTFNYFNLSQYGGGWQYEVTRDWTDKAFTNGKFIWQDASCIIGLLSAYNLTSNQTYLRYAEDIWNWDRAHFWDNTYGGYYVRLNQDNSIAIDDKGIYEHGWFGLATVALYDATGNTSYRTSFAELYAFVTNNFYDVGDGSYYGALTRSLSVSESSVDTNWVAPYARFLIAAFKETGNTTYGDKATELIDNLLAHAYDPIYGWIVNRVSSDWSSFTNTAKGWYDVLQTFIDAYQVFSNSTYLTSAQRFFDDIQQANSTTGYLMEMNRDWTSSVNDELLGEEDPGVAIAYLRIATELENNTIVKEAYRYKDAIFDGLNDPVYDGIYRRIYSGGSQSTWKQWCGAGRVMEMLAVFALNDSSSCPIEPSPSYVCETVGSTPYTVYWGAAAGTNQGVYAFGGFTGSGRTSSIFLFNTTTNSSEIMSSSFNVGVSQPTAQTWGDYIFIFGGNNGSDMDSIYKYDYTNDMLTLLTTKIPQPMKEIGSAFDGTYIYLIGGFGSSPERKNTIYRFDPSTENIINTGETLPEGLSQTTPVWGGDAVYIFGGHEFGGSAHTYILKYNTSSNQCTQITTTMPYALSSMTAVWDGGDQIFIFGGALDGYSGNTHFDTIYVFDTTDETISLHNLTIPDASIFHFTAMTGQSTYIIGGSMQSGTILNTVVRFGPLQPLVDDDPPVVDHPSDIIIEQGCQEQIITWTPSDSNPSNYSILVDSDTIEQGFWSGEQISYNVSYLDEGTYDVTLIIEDVFHKSASDSVLVQIIPSTPPIIDPQDDFTVEAITGFYEIVWSPSDFTPLSYEVELNGTLETAGSWDNTSITVHVTGLDPGCYNYTLIVYDGAENFAVDTVIVTCSDTTNPEVSSPEDINFEAGMVGNIINWTISDFYPYEYEVFRNGSQVEKDSWSNGDIVISLDNLEPGVYLYSIIVVDASLNTASDTLWVRISDTTAPIVSEPSNITIESGEYGIITWITDELYPEIYQVLRNGTTIYSGDWNQTVVQISIDSLDVGTFNYTIILNDRYGNFVTNTVFIQVIDTTAPTVSEPEDVSIEAGSTGFSIIWISYELHPESCEIIRNGIVIYSGLWNQTIVQIPLESLGLGEYNYTLTLNDICGNSVTDTVIVHVADTTAPTINAPTDVTYEYLETGNNITWIATDILPSHVEIHRNGSWLGNIEWDGDPITISIDGLESGVYIFSISAFDTSGNSVSDSVLVTVEMPSPIVYPMMLTIFASSSIVVIIIVIACYRGKN